jgi:hypothetical protein
MAEIFDPRAGMFTDAAPLDEGRMAHDACLLPDGRVLVAGGWADAKKATTATTEIYDPVANRWTSGPRNLPFHAHDLILVPLWDDHGNGAATPVTLLAIGGKSTTGDEATACFG